MYTEYPMDESTSTTNSVTRHDDYIEVIWHGAQSSEKVSQSNAKAIEAAKELEAKNRPILLSLCILDHPLKPNMGAFKESLEILHQVSFSRVVICGNLPLPLLELVSTVISSFNRELEIAYFVDPKEALVWLRSDRPGSRTLL